MKYIYNQLVSSAISEFWGFEESGLTAHMFLKQNLADSLIYVKNEQMHHMSICSTDKPEAAPSKTEISDKLPVIHVHPSSKYFLLCPVTSHHATYHWYHGKTHEECVHSEKGCLYLVDSMNETHEGEYRCESSEEGYTRTVSEYKLSMSRSDARRLTPALLLLLTASHVLLLTFWKYCLQVPRLKKKIHFRNVLKAH